MDATIDLLAVETDLLEVSRRLAQLVAEAPASGQKVRGLEWTVGELGAHITTVLDWPAYSMALVDPTVPGAHPRYNEQLLNRFSERDPLVLADLIEDNGAKAVEAFGDDPTRRVFAFGLQRDVASYAAVLLGELLVHGYDLARTLRRPWPITADQARTVFYGAVPILPHLVDKDVARGMTALFEIRLHGSPPVMIRVENGAVSTDVREHTSHADLHVVADPVTYLLVGYGRRSVWRAAATAKIVSWGSKPWLGLKLRKLFVTI